MPVLHQPPEVQTGNATAAAPAPQRKRATSAVATDTAEPARSERTDEKHFLLSDVNLSQPKGARNGTKMHDAIRECRTVEDYLAWDRFLYEHPGAHYFQTYGWLKSYAPMGMTAHVLIVEQDGIVTGGVAFLSVKIPLLPYCIVIVPHGPLPSDPGSSSWLRLMERLDHICRETKAIYVQIYPHELSSQSILLLKLEELGFTSPALFESHHFSSMPVLVDLAGKSEEEVLGSFRKRTISYVRGALRSDLTIRTEVTPAVLERIYALFVEHGESRGFRPRPLMSIRAAWEWLAPNGWATIIQAWHEDELVGANLVMFTGRTAYYIHGAVRRDYADRRPAEFIHWHTIRRAIELGLDHYDLVNMVSSGVEQFKRGFRPTSLSWHDPRTKIYRPTTAKALGAADRYLRPIIREFARRRAN
jgi:hypothetical protein